MMKEVYHEKDVDFLWMPLLVLLMMSGGWAASNCTPEGKAKNRRVELVEQ